jgi:hypothetical protein
MRVDELRRAMRVLGIDLRRHQHRGVAERTGVEDRRDLADDPLVEQALDAGQNLVLGHPRRLGDARERIGAQREAALHQVEQLLVGLVQRNRRAVAPGPDLSYGFSHRATSFAW